MSKVHEIWNILPVRHWGPPRSFALLWMTDERAEEAAVRCSLLFAASLPFRKFLPPEMPVVEQDHGSLHLKSSLCHNHHTYSIQQIFSADIFEYEYSKLVIIAKYEF